MIRVRDTGIGIDPGLAPVIFDLFVQSDRSLARSQGGLGIGLTLVKRLVEMHGGTVGVTSAGTGRGSEFTVRLPVLSTTQTDSHRQPVHPELRPTGSCRRVLVVDDNVDVAKSTATLLRLLDQEVETAHDGHAAIEAVRTFRPDIVLLDIGLPGLSGFDVAKALRARPEHRDLMLVAVTGYGMEEDRRQSEEAGFDHHLVKPVHPAALAQLVTSFSQDPAARTMEYYRS